MTLAIVALTTQADDSAGPKNQPPWEFMTGDTNTGVGGKYIYIGFQLGSDNPVTSLDFVAYDHAQSSPPSGWSWTGQDMNEGAGGKYIYMIWKNGESKSPITGLAMIASYGLSKPPTMDGFEAIWQDLNEGAGGPYIWVYFSTSIQMPSQKKAVIDKL